MINSKQMKLARKAIAGLTDQQVTGAVVGSIKDIKDKVHPGSASIIPLWREEGTIDAVTAVEGWDTNPEIIDHIVAGILGRFGHYLLMQLGLDFTMLSVNQATELMSSTDAMQERIVKQLVGAAEYDAYKAAAPGPGSVEF